MSRIQKKEEAQLIDQKKWCRKHGYYNGRFCPDCEEEKRDKRREKAIDDWWINH